MTRLREEVKKAAELKQPDKPHCHAHPGPPPPPLPLSSRTEATRLPKTGERKRVARQTATSSKRVSSQQRNAGTEATSGRGGGGKGELGRGVASDIIRQRREDEQSNIITEKYSRLRIK